MAPPGPNDVTYFKTVPGILKIFEIIFAIVCIACASPVVTNYEKYFMFVVATCFVITILFSVAYFFSWRVLFEKVPWLVLEFFFSVGAVVLYFIAVVVQFVMSTRGDYKWGLEFLGLYDQYIAAGVFAALNTVAYIVSTLYLFGDCKESPSEAPPAV